MRPFNARWTPAWRIGTTAPRRRPLRHLPPRLPGVRTGSRPHEPYPIGTTALAAEMN